MRVLIVDDDKNFAAAVAALLATLHGIELVGAAHDGEEAISKAHELQPDVVLMDVDMPRLNGLSATHRIQAALPETRVVILSGSDVEAHIAGAHSAGVIAHIRKENFAVDLPVVLSALRGR